MTINIAHSWPNVVLVWYFHKILPITQKESHCVQWAAPILGWLGSMTLPSIPAKRHDKQEPFGPDESTNSLWHNLILLFPLHSKRISQSFVFAYLLPHPTTSTGFCSVGSVTLYSFLLLVWESYCSECWVYSDRRRVKRDFQLEMQSLLGDEVNS